MAGPENKPNRSSSSAGKVKKKAGSKARPKQTKKSVPTAQPARNSASSPKTKQAGGIESSSSAKKKPKMNKKARRILIGAAAAIVVLLLIVFNPFSLQAQLDEGHKLLEALETQNVEDVQRTVLEARRDELNEMIAAGTFNASSIMSDAVIIGDSRAEGYASYQILPPERVLATIGERADKISSWKDSVEKLQPSTIYISYGGNDLSFNTGSELGPDGYGKLYEQQIDELLAVDPNAKIVINSIIEPTPAVAAAEPWWSMRDDFNRQLRELCERRGWIYVDNSQLSDGGNAPIYDRDGMHFLPAFYPQWAANMAMTLIESDL